LWTTGSDPWSCAIWRRSLRRYPYPSWASQWRKSRKPWRATATVSSSSKTNRNSTRARPARRARSMPRTPNSFRCIRAARAAPRRRARRAVVCQIPISVACDRTRPRPLACHRLSFPLLLSKKPAQTAVQMAAGVRRVALTTWLRMRCMKVFQFPVPRRTTTLRPTVQISLISFLSSCVLG